MTLYSIDGIEVELPPQGEYWIAPNAVIIGQVKLGSFASVWFGATIRGDNDLIDIGERTNIQDGCVLHTDTGFKMVIAEGCTVGHMAMLHGCTIGPNTLIGIGSTVLNGARIGARCLIGAGALITDGKEIPQGSLVMGVPGKVIRQLDDKARAGLLASAVGYQNNMRRFRAELQEAN